MYKVHKTFFLKQFLISVMILGLVFYSTVYFIYKNEKQVIINEVKLDSTYPMNLKVLLVKELFSLSFSEFSYFTQRNKVNQFINDPSKVEFLKDEFIWMALKNPSFKQIRFIDSSGMEIIRLNMSKDSLQIAPKIQLQDKSLRPYFIESKQLNKNELFISDIELNIENGKIEYPFQLVVRYSYPVFDSKKVFLGAVVVNQYLNDLFNELGNNWKNSFNNFMILNSNGYFLNTSFGHDLFGFGIDSLENQNLATTDSLVWNRIENKSSSIFNTEEEIIISRNVRFDFWSNKNAALKYSHLKIKRTEPLSIYLVSIININNNNRIKILDEMVVKKYWLVTIVICVLSLLYTYFKVNNEKHKIKLIEINKNLELLVEEKTAELLEINKNLEQRNDELEQFAYIASHDLQEPIRTITSFSEVLKSNFSKKLGDEGAKYLDFIFDSSVRMRNLILALLNYSTIGKENSLELSNCNEIIQDLMEDINELILEKKVKINFSKLPKLLLYRAEFQQLMLNLILNSIKFSKPDSAPEIKIEAISENNSWHFVVSDNGIGIEEKYLNKIFVIFQRLHSQKDYKGTGIGLAICKKVVDLHNGKIWVKSVPEKGSEFHFTISNL